MQTYCENGMLCADFLAQWNTQEILSLLFSLVSKLPSPVANRFHPECFRWPETGEGIFHSSGNDTHKFSGGAHCAGISHSQFGDLEKMNGFPGPTFLPYVKGEERGTGFIGLL